MSRCQKPPAFPFVRLTAKNPAIPWGAWQAPSLKRRQVEYAALQRRLGDAGTAYIAEVGKVRLAHAQRLLVETDLKLEVIALQVGCANSSGLRKLFGRLVGMSPLAWREAQRRSS